MKSTSRNGGPPPGAVGGLIAAIGLGIAAWYGYEWYRVPRWTEQEIVGSVELNLAMDLSRHPPDSVPRETQDRMRAQIRREVEAQIEHESETPRTWTYAGLLMGVLGLVQMALRIALARSSTRG
jgi:hypothetical protein